MKRTIHAAFGYVVYKNTFEPNEEFIADTSQPNPATIFYTVGHISSFDQNGQLVLRPEPGSLILAHDALIGVFPSVVSSTGAECICIDPKSNRGYIPDVEVFALTANETASLPQGTKLLLCSGSLNVDGRTFSNVAQIHLKSDDMTVAAVTNCYGLIIQ